MHVCILHNEVEAHAGLEDQDVLVQVAAVRAALDALGHEATTVSCTLDLARVRNRLEALRPQLVFNLVEGLEGADSLSPVAPALLDALGMRYTGNGTQATFLTAHKLMAKRWMSAVGLPTPPWIETARQPPPALGGVRKWILKGVWEQASRDLDEEAIVDGDAATVAAALDERRSRLGRPGYAEAFVSGREFNLSLLTQSGNGCGSAGAAVVPPLPLPPAEIDFSTFPPEKPRIVGYRAKWHEDSFEYQNTPRRFDFAAADGPLLAELQRLALRAWHDFGLRGYARVDFRVDEQGTPWILEVNTNPCLSPDAGFAAALQRAEIPFGVAVAAILNEANA